MYMSPLNFTISDINGCTVISGGVVNDPSRFEDDSELIDFAYLNDNAPTFHVHYTSFLWNVGEGDVQYPSDEEISLIRSMYDHHDPGLFEHIDFLESGSYEVGNPAWEYNEE